MHCSPFSLRSRKEARPVPTRLKHPAGPQPGPGRKRMASPMCEWRNLTRAYLQSVGRGGKSVAADAASLSLHHPLTCRAKGRGTDVGSWEKAAHRSWAWRTRSRSLWCPGGDRASRKAPHCSTPAAGWERARGALEGRPAWSAQMRSWGRGVDPGVSPAGCMVNIVLTRPVTCPCLKDSGKADHIDNYRSWRWQDLTASLTSSSCQGRRRSPGRRR